MADWQLIDSAPKDGAKILGYDPTLLKYCIAWWEDGGWYADASSQDGDGYYNTPLSHWQPLTVPSDEP